MVEQGFAPFLQNNLVAFIRHLHSAVYNKGWLIVIKKYDVYYAILNHRLMKNKYSKGAHLSERKFRELLSLFAEDLTATQIADISAVSRVTVNSYLKKIRQRIALHNESLLQAAMPHKVSSALLLTPDPPGDITPSPSLRKPVIVGIFKVNDRVHTEIIPEAGPALLQGLGKGRLQPDDAALVEEYEGVADLSQYRLYNVRKGASAPAVQASEGIEAFWGLTRHRLVKFKGLNSGTVYLHLRECEFRYNHREEDLFPILLTLLKEQPLHLLTA